MMLHLYPALCTQVALGSEFGNGKNRYLETLACELDPVGPLASADDKDVAGHHARHPLYNPKISKKRNPDGSYKDHKPVNYVAEVRMPASALA